MIRISLLSALFISVKVWSLVAFLPKLQDMTQNSDRIVHAVVVGSESKYDEKGRIITTTTLKIIEELKAADKANFVTVYQVGGEIDGKVFQVPGAHHYRIGEEVFLFGLNMAHENTIVSYGLGFGKFSVGDRASKARVVEELPDLHFASIHEKEWQLAPKARVFASAAAFKKEIKQLLKTRSSDKASIVRPLFEDPQWQLR